MLVSEMTYNLGIWLIQKIYIHYKNNYKKTQFFYDIVLYHVVSDTVHRNTCTIHPRMCVLFTTIFVFQYCYMVHYS